MAIALAGCSGTKAASDDYVKGGGDYSVDPTYDFSGGEAIPSGYVDGDIEGGGDAAPMPSGDVEEEPVAPGDDGNSTKPQARQLTCSALDDNEKYDYWKSLSEYQEDQNKGIFQTYREDFAFNTFNRIGLTINNGKNISVKIEGDSFSTAVDNLHHAYLFPQSVKEVYEAEISFIDNNNERQTITREVHDGDVIDLENTFVISENLQIMFVIDATGSMGDEMEYIKSEIDDVISRVKEANANAHIELAMMVYRDKGDDYLTKYSDFTTDITSQQDFLSGQRANGGGDFEEAVQTALTEAMEKQWSTNATKLLFHVADAPAHDEDVPTWNNAALKAAEQGIKIITVASSGINKKTEYFFRSQSLLTSGQYVYLTNDSGIGGHHIDATVSEKITVEYLNDCLVRLINGYYSGEFAEPVSYQQVQ